MFHIEDERHFVFEGVLYNDERQSFIKPYYLRRQSMFISLLNCFSRRIELYLRIWAILFTKVSKNEQNSF